MTTTKFVAMTEEVQEKVIWVDDMEASIKEVGYNEALDIVMDRVFVGDLKCSGSIHVIDDDKNLAANMTNELNNKYAEELELMKNVKGAVKEENVIVADATTEEKKAAAIAKSDKAQKFLNKHADKVKKTEDKKVENKKEETKVEDKNVVKSNRRRLDTGAAKSEETKVENKTNEKVETEMNKPNRKSTTRVLKNDDKKQATGNRKRLGRSESIKNEFHKFEGPWYLNSSMYSVLDRFEEVLETMSDAELGIEEIVLVNPEEVSRTRNNPNITVVIQIKANGNILEFPIKEVDNANSSSDLSSTSIGWIETKNGMRPAFGFYRPNEINVKATCTCGKEFKANTGNLYCPSCKKRHDDAEVSISHKLDMECDGAWVFQTVPNLVVPRETLALVMAIAQYDAGFDMWGVVEE
jgi:hypothetical protein